jgi:hypothetical protein
MTNMKYLFDKEILDELEEIITVIWERKMEKYSQDVIDFLIERHCNTMQMNILCLLIVLTYFLYVSLFDKLKIKSARIQLKDIM